MIAKSKEKAIEDVNVCFEKIVNIINRRKGGDMKKKKEEAYIGVALLCPKCGCVQVRGSGHALAPHQTSPNPWVK